MKLESKHLMRRRGAVLVSLPWKRRMSATEAEIAKTLVRKMTAMAISFMCVVACPSWYD